jgi:uncharacterized membrane protein YphA (DoxX/SURF4 family)
MGKILHWHETEVLVLNVLSEWQSYLSSVELAQELFSKLIPWSSLLLIVGTLMELVGGLMVLLGIKQKLGATLLIFFLAPATLFIHQFWFGESHGMELQTTLFLKNCAIIGGLILILLKGEQDY